jgi:serine/threonine protein kinase
MSTQLKRIGRYELSKRLVSGKTNEVWIAFDPRSRDYVTLKVFYTSLKVDSEAMLQFQQYIERVASLKHPNIVPLRDMLVFPSSNPDTSSITSMVCIVLDYVEGQTLADYLQHTKSAGRMRPGPDMVHLFTSLSLAIDYAHQQGIIHGNLNPGSILLKPDDGTPGQIGDPMLTDFDYTRLLQNTGAAISPFYLSPEQIRGHSASEQSDTYSLGVILYELCTGVLPFRGNRPFAIMMQHLNAPPTPPEVMNTTISSTLSNVILRSLAKEPEKRFPDASSLTIALAYALNTPVPELNEHQSLLHDSTEPWQQNGISTATPPPGNGTGTSFPSMAELRKHRKNSLGSWYIICILVLLCASLGTIVALLFIPQNKAATPNQLVGHAFFVSSGQFNADSPQGINDELQIDLAGISDPPVGKSYYAWLLADQNVSESLPILLGSLHVKQGNIRFLYPGDQQHINLLGVTSRFLITLDDTQHPTNNPLLDTTSWRYYAFIPLLPSSVDKLHFSMLDHLRHLLFESPELINRNLH